MLRRTIFLVYIALASALDYNAVRKEMMSDPNFIAVKSECLKLHSATDEEVLKDYKSDEIPENVMCFMKCIEEKEGMLDDQGMLVLDKIGAMPVFGQLDKATGEKIMDCMKGLGKVDTCQDIIKVKDCFHKNL